HIPQDGELLENQALGWVQGYGLGGLSEGYRTAPIVDLLALCSGSGFYPLYFIISNSENNGVLLFTLGHKTESGLLFT
ncbi:MAG: hypothetical protein M3362_26950, partial [Acidobacteriota bacterium]|nr:hypothetical protein [Acidobacteriota bacterium]